MGGWVLKHSSGLSECPGPAGTSWGALLRTRNSSGSPLPRSPSGGACCCPSPPTPGAWLDPVSHEKPLRRRLLLPSPPTPGAWLDPVSHEKPLRRRLLLPSPLTPGAWLDPVAHVGFAPPSSTDFLLLSGGLPGEEALRCPNSISFSSSAPSWYSAPSQALAAVSPRDAMGTGPLGLGGRLQGRQGHVSRSGAAGWAVLSLPLIHHPSLCCLPGPVQGAGDSGRGLRALRAHGLVGSSEPITRTTAHLSLWRVTSATKSRHTVLPWPVRRGSSWPKAHGNLP